MSEIAFSSEIKRRFDALVAKYEVKRSALLPTLYLAQEQWGYLTPENMAYVGKLLDVSSREVTEAAMFYTMFRKKDMGKWCLQVCNNVTCTMMGSEDLLRVIKEELGISPDEVTTDKKFSCQIVQCLGSCDTAPVVQCNEDYVERLDAERFRDYLRNLKTGNEAAAKELHS